MVVNFDLQQMKAQRQETAKAVETGTLTKEQERGMTAEQKAALEKATKERQAAMAKNKALNDAFNAGMEAMKTKQCDAGDRGVHQGRRDGSEAARDLG